MDTKEQPNGVTKDRSLLLSWLNWQKPPKSFSHAHKKTQQYIYMYSPHLAVSSDEAKKLLLFNSNNNNIGKTKPKLVCSILNPSVFQVNQLC